MKKIISVCIVSLAAVACGQARDARVHPLMTEHYDAFMADCAKYNADCKTNNVTIDLVDVLPKKAPKDAIGYCKLRMTKRGIVRNIYILTFAANGESSASAKQVFYHEAGHCMVGLLGMSHFNSKPDIMNSDVANAAEIEANWLTYVDAMFARMPKKP